MTTLTLSFISKSFNEFNKEFFDGKLPIPNFVIGHRRSSFGIFCGGTMTITISNYYNRGIDDYRETILHEMVHLWQWVTFRHCDHKDTFKRMSRNIYAKSNGMWNIQRTTGFSTETTISSDKLKVEHLLIARSGNKYIVGKVSADKADNIASWLRKCYYKNITHFLAKGEEFAKMRKSYTQFNYAEYSLTDFEAKIRPALIEQLKVCSYDQNIPFVKI